MSLNLVPDYYFEKFNDITPEFLLKEGIKGVILDIDNTLEPYEHDKPGEHVLAWLKSLKDVGIKAAFVSNNKKSRVETFNKEIGLPAFSKARKPFKKRLLHAMMLMNTNEKNTISIGDQILTDVWAAHNANIKAILVPPINDRRDPFTKFKRLLEKPFLRKYRKRKARAEKK